MQSLRTSLSATALIILATISASRVTAEPALSAYGGWTGNFNSESTAATTTPPGLALPSFDEQASNDSKPVHIGARFSYWSGATSRWGLAGDYTRARTLARMQAAPSTSPPTLAPLPAPGGPAMPVESRDIEQSHDLVTINGLYRWLEPEVDDTHPRHWFVPYVGLGVGLAVLPVETRASGLEGFEDRLSGPAAQGLLGGEVLIAGPWSMFVEYKLSWTDLTSTTPNGDSLSLEQWTHHMAVGVTMKF